MKKRPVFIVLLLLLAACSPVRTDGVPRIATASPTRATPTGTPTPRPSDTVTPAYEACGWVWATQPLPELDRDLQEAFEEAGLEGVTVTAGAFGENCLSAENTVLYFATMETDFYISMLVEDINDKDRMGTTVERILEVLDAFPPGTVPGGVAGRITIRFTGPTEEKFLNFTVTDGQETRQAGLRGAALFEELEKR